MFSNKKSGKSLFSLFNLVILFVCLFLVSRSAKCEDETTTITTDIATFETTTLFSFIEEDRGIKSDCIDREVVLLRNLTFGRPPSTAIIGQNELLIWGEEEFYPIECLSEFVVFYREDVKGSPTSILCTSYNVERIGKTASRFGCYANFTEEDCNKTVTIALEAWTVTGQLLQPSSKPVLIDCDAVDYVTPLESDVESDANVTIGEVESDDVSETSTDEQSTDSSNLVDHALVEADVASGNETNHEALFCLWTEWSIWSTCSISCGAAPGVRTRFRGQRGSQKCQKKERETKECHVNLCPVDCLWAEWQEWTTCSQTCGTGKRTRMREKAVLQAYEGTRCQDKDREEVETCTLNICAVDGQWSDWGHWGYCSVSCGQGQKKRTRLCNKPSPEHGGLPCEGQDFETGNCTHKVCQPIDGNWSHWSRWSPCNKGCGKGNITRTRTCSSPRASSGGQPCEGEQLQSRVCFLKRCLDSTSNDQPITISPFVHESSVVFRPTQRTKITTTTVATATTSVHSSATTTTVCDEAPKILGFDGPFRNVDIGVVDDEESVFYECVDGKVVDIYTNRRIVRLPCANVTQFRSPKKWPKCKRPTHCVGPAQKVDSGSVYLPIPRRDSPVNSIVRYTCNDDSAIFASCFSDGNYRYPSSFPDCANENPEIHKVCQIGNSENSTEIFAGSKVGDYGWIQSDSYPSLLNGSTDCQFVLTIPPGHSVQIGFEDFYRDDKDEIDSDEESESLKKRPRLEDDDEEELLKPEDEAKNDSQEVYDKFGTFREDRKLDKKDKKRKKEKNSEVQKVGSFILTDSSTGAVLLRAPLTAVSGMSFKTKFESSVYFILDFPPNIGTHLNSFRFRLNYVLI